MALGTEGNYQPRSEHFGLVAFSAIISCLTVIENIGQWHEPLPMSGYQFFSGIALLFLLIPIGIPATIAMLLFSWRHRDRLLQRMTLLTISFNTALFAAYVWRQSNPKEFAPLDANIAVFLLPVLPITLTILLIKSLSRARGMAEQVTSALEAVISGDER